MGFFFSKLCSGEDTEKIKDIAKLVRKAEETTVGNFIVRWLGLDVVDDSRAEATFRYTVENISKLKETQLSPAVMVRNLPW